MAFCLASRGLQISLVIQSRGLLISSCSQFRAKKGYKSSGPVRYIPRDYVEIKKTQKSSPMESSLKKETSLFRNEGLEGGRGSQKIITFDDNEFQNSILDAEINRSSDSIDDLEELSELESASSSSMELIDTDVVNESEPMLDDISHPHENKTAEWDEVMSNEIMQDAEKVAIELLAARAFTAFELKKKLRAKKFPLNIVESVVADIKCRGMINDGLYAESFSQSRWLSSTWGPRRIKQALIQKGVSGADADKATKQVFEGDDASGDGVTIKHGMSKPSMDRLFLQASKQWLRGQNTTLENRKARIVRWLQYRGFNWGVTNFVLKKLESEYPH